MASKSLKIERHAPDALKKWFERRRRINFDPPYQRKPGLWSDGDKALLIDTIINGFDIPKFYMSDFGWRSSRLEQAGDFVYAIIDGKQRLQAIFDFFSNDIPLNEDCVWRFDENASIGGLYYRDIESRYPRIATIIDEYIIDVMSVSTDDAEDINRIFKRLNKGKALAGAEVRNAALGPVADMIRIVARHDFFQESVAFNTLRLGDNNAAAKLLFFEFNSFPTSTKKVDLDKFVDDAEVTAESIEAAGLKCLSHLELMFQIFGRHDALLRSAGQIPVYYWSVRQLPPESLGSFRVFLFDFEKRRAKNRRLQSAGLLDGVDPVLSRYDTLNRNTNDVGSHRARISILLRSYCDWIQRQGHAEDWLVDVREASRRFDDEVRERVRPGFEFA